MFIFSNFTITGILMKPAKACASNVEPELIAIDNDDSNDLKVESVNSVKVTVEYNKRKNTDNGEQNNPECDLQNKNNLGILFETTPVTPVTVQDWVAALPDDDKDIDEEEINSMEESNTDDNDNLKLGAEG